MPVVPKLMESCAEGLNGERCKAARGSPMRLPLLKSNKWARSSKPIAAGATQPILYNFKGLPPTVAGQVVVAQLLCEGGPYSVGAHPARWARCAPS